MNMSFKPDETAVDLMRRLKTKPFEFIHHNTVTRLNFGESVEIQTSYSRFLEVKLDLIEQFVRSNGNDCSVVIHFTTGCCFFQALQQSGINLNNHYGFHQLISTDNIKNININSMISFMAFIELLDSSLLSEKVLILFDGLNSLFLANKVSMMFYYCYYF